MHIHPTEPRAKPVNEKCWRVPGASDIVMFNGHHTRDFIPHSHDVVTIVLVTRGAYRFELDGMERIVQAGDLVVVGADQVHSGRPVHADGWEMRSLHVPPDFLAKAKVDPFRTGEPVTFSDAFPSGRSQAASLFLGMHRAAATRSDIERQQEQLDTFFNWFGNNLDVFRPRIGACTSPDAQVEQAKSLILHAAFDSTQIDAIAEEVGLSTYALIRRFKRHYGIPPHAWRIQVRANRVAQMLRDGGAQLVDIAARCGFADQAHMTRIFRSVYGVTPGQYRIGH